MGEYGKKSLLKIPEQIVFGTNTVEDLGDYAQGYGKNAVLIFGGASLVKSGSHGRILDILNKKNIQVVEISGITHDPDERTIKTAVDRVKQIKPDVIIGAGGGSVLDAAKAASIIAPNGGEVKDYWAGKSFTKASIPYIAMPTTSGTGTEVTKNAVITNQDKNLKKSIRSELMIPNIALVDPSLTFGAPTDITASTGLDALIQNLEAYTSKNSGPISDTFARKGIELAGKYLLKAVKDPGDHEAREGLALSSLYGGISLLSAGLGLAHGLSHPIGIRFGIPHGKACAIVMPKVMEYNYPACVEKYSDAGMLLSGIKDGVKAFNKLLEELDISTKLEDYGITKDDIPAIVANSRGGSRNYNPVGHSDPTVVKMLEELLKY
ncbi:MAG TPA: iron-containing alcohol dehydrogenase [Spirochaetes bacterium]|nr:iron-containing alcohol dehydrogenase [Spirochaetota bacterium]